VERHPRTGASHTAGHKTMRDGSEDNCRRRIVELLVVQVLFPPENSEAAPLQSNFPPGIT